ncbi:uncharacterized protein LOC126368625 [Pectinophora gossypiella]|uniref:uncharacterized protein LOC126368625 n=1 Tax=Pectinophora gossypiella TaxID=13191 RepID=UPI00214EF226|nr:uncharacterized protein LOC126368625 [Pectinophora gossypiella]
MKENIHVVKSSITSFNSTISKLNQNELKLNSQIDKLNEILSSTVRSNNNLIYTSRLNIFINIIEGSLLTISNFLDSIINAILFAKVNVLHPSILSPTNLFNELSKRSSSVDNKLDFPVPLNLDNIHTLMDVSKLISYYYNNKIIFIIQIPLISPIKYVVYKTIPLPTPHEKTNPNTFALITPTKSYIALTDDRSHYSLLDNMQQCSVLNNEYSICPLENIFSSVTNPCCETKLLTEVTLSLPDECNSKMLYGLIDIWQKLKNNRWIFVQSKTSKLTLKCNNEMKDYSISGTGILTLEENCIGFSKTIRLEPSTVTNIAINNYFNIDFDIIQDDCCKKDNVNKSIPLLSPLTLSNIDLDSLKHSYKQLDDLERDIHRIKNESHFTKYAHYYSSFSIFCICLIFFYFGYKLYNYCYKNYKNHNSHCCIQIFNQCTTTRKKMVGSNVTNSIELDEISEASVEPVYGTINKTNTYKRNIDNN